MARIDAYAYYLSTYGQNRPTRYDSHKRSDLRKVYNQIIKTNREAPLYKLSGEDEVAKYAIDIKENDFYRIHSQPPFPPMIKRSIHSCATSCNFSS